MPQYCILAIFTSNFLWSVKLNRGAVFLYIVVAKWGGAAVQIAKLCIKEIHIAYLHRDKRHWWFLAY